MKYAKASGVTRWSGGTVVLKAGQSIEDNHPLLEERPDLFRDGDGEADIKVAPEGRTRHRTPEVETTANTGPAGRRMLPNRGRGGASTGG